MTELATPPPPRVVTASHASAHAPRSYPCAGQRFIADGNVSRFYANESAGLALLWQSAPLRAFLFPCVYKYL